MRDVADCEDASEAGTKTVHKTCVSAFNATHRNERYNVFCKREAESRGTATCHVGRRMRVVAGNVSSRCEFSLRSFWAHLITIKESISVQLISVVVYYILNGLAGR
jgi:hypothetical protein